MIRVITQSEFFQGEHAIVHALFEVGLMELLLRKPTASSSDIIDWIKGIDEQYRDRIVVYEQQVEQVEGVKGFHHKGNEQTELAHTWYSRSCHGMDELVEFENSYEYLVLSPIFKSLSKANYGPEINWDLSSLSTGLKNKLIALGGISEQRLEELHQLGFKHIALLGAIWLSPDPILAFKTIDQKWGKYAQKY